MTSLFSVIRSSNLSYLSFITVHTTPGSLCPKGQCLHQLFQFLNLQLLTLIASLSFLTGSPFVWGNLDLKDLNLSIKKSFILDASSEGLENILPFQNSCVPVIPHPSYPFTDFQTLVGSFFFKSGWFCSQTFLSYLSLERAWFLKLLNLLQSSGWSESIDFLL